MTCFFYKSGQIQSDPLISSSALTCIVMSFPESHTTCRPASSSLFAFEDMPSSSCHSADKQAEVIPGFETLYVTYFFFFFLKPDFQDWYPQCQGILVLFFVFFLISSIFPPTSLLATISLFSVSMGLFLFCFACSFVLVFEIPHISEIMRYLSFSVWLSSLSTDQLVLMWH